MIPFLFFKLEQKKIIFASSINIKKTNKGLKQIPKQTAHGCPAIQRPSHNSKTQQKEAKIGVHIGK